MSGAIRRLLCRHDWEKVTIFFPPPPHDGMVKATCKKCQKVKRYPGEITPHKTSPEELASLGKLAEVMKARRES